ncbi:glycosyl hydrolase 108 family protein [Azorhizobium sp. AG788]|uniref:glycoside hydrolase family 108 protein n=1 Tax=Azorhizobium sp. AG788 TaxID=2183897 RepID=UPI0031387457
MAASSFEAALARVLGHEGGYSNHPADPGGPTMQGVIQRVYDGYRTRHGQPLRPVRQIERGELIAIYRSQYWDAVRGDDLPAGLDYVVFDGAVNSGPGQAAKWLQRALGLPADGQVGAVTLAAAARCADLGAMVDDICDRRLAMLKRLTTWPVFGAGWGRRVAEVRRIGHAWAQSGAVPVAEDAAMVPVRGMEAGARPAGGSAKAPLASARPAPRPDAATGAAAGGVLASATGEAARQLEPLTGASPTIALVFTGLTVLGVLVTLAALGAVWWGEHRRRQRADALDLAPAPAPAGSAS